MSAALDPQLPAVVLSLDANPFHHGALAAVRTLGRAGVPVLAVLDRWAAPLAASRHLVGTVRWAVDPREEAAAVDGLEALGRALHARWGRPLLPVPVDDLTAVLLAEHAERLKPWWCLSATPGPLARRLTDKAGLAEACHAAGVPAPAAVAVRTPADLQALPAVPLPWVVKPLRPWAAPGVPRVSLVRTAAEVRDLLVLAPDGVLVQEHLPASPGGDAMFIGHVRADGTSPFWATAVKLRAWPAHGGLTRCGRSLDLPEVAQASMSAARALGYTGLVDLDWRRDPRDGSWQLLDWNPRLGAQFRLTAREDGLDAVRALHVLAAGRCVPAAPPPQGRVLHVEQYELLGLPAAVRKDGWRAWWAVGRGRRRELAWWSPDDPGPAFVLLARLLLRAAGGATRRPRPHGPVVRLRRAAR